MSLTRVIARLDVKSEHLVKGIHLEGLRKVGDPHAFARKYYHEGIDEIFYVDIVASLYERNSLVDLIRASTEDIFIPVTVAGGLRSLDDVTAVMRAGADRVAINTAAIKNPRLLTEIAHRYGAQCMVLSIEAKQQAPHRWEAYFDNGRERSGKDVVEWAIEGVKRGAGEILLTSVDREGTQQGFDVELIQAVSDAVTAPVIACGGMGKLEHAVKAIRAGADACAVAHVLHYNLLSIQDIKHSLQQAGIDTRAYP